MRIEVTIAKLLHCQLGLLTPWLANFPAVFSMRFLIMKATYRYVMPQRIIYRLLAQQKKINSALAKFSRKRGKAPMTGLSANNMQ
ncbi:Uncharacterised protein [Escherichia coli]|uniref:Uncharacterized protein n=1 Tax=Escherichia coli TaxID=562 RepID=A0A376MVB1_ECOLX|nr:Uncharacterised protein [Escherichia coli]